MSDTKPCPACKMNIATDATRCPYCTTRFFNMAQQVAFALLMLIVIALIYRAFAG